MNKILVTKLAALLCLLSMVSCAEHAFDDWKKELYTRNFIKDFGLIDPQHDWNMAQAAVVTVNVGDQKVSRLKVYGKQGSKFYLVADLDDVSGTLAIPVDIPKDCTDLLIKADGRKYYGSVGEVVDLTAKSRADLGTGTTYTPRKDNTNDPLTDSGWNEVQNGYTMYRKYTHGAPYGDNKEYQWFNTQQMAPIVTPEGQKWADYYSLNQGKMVYNTGEEGGLLPESGIFTRTIDDFTDHVSDMRAHGHTMTYDFTVTVEDGTFTFFPYYYGTNFTHDLGVYLLDKNGNPILKNGDTYVEGNTYDPLTDFVTFKIFEDRMTGDLQTQPHYYDDVNTNGKEVKALKVKAYDVATETYLNSGNYLNAGSDLYLTKGQKIQFEFWAYDNEEGTGTPLFSNTNDVTSELDFFDTYHTRVAYHVWDKKDDNDHSREPYTFATVTSDGLMTATEAVDPGYMDITVGSRLLYTDDSKSTTLVDYTGVTSVIGPRVNLNVHITDNSTTTTETEINKIDVNPAASTAGDNLRYDTFGKYNNIVFYIPKGTTVTLPVEAYKGSDKVIEAKELDKIDINQYDSSSYYTVSKSNGVFTVTTTNTVTPSSLNIEDVDGSNNNLPWVNLYIESNGQTGYQYGSDKLAFGFKIIVYDPTTETVKTPHKHTETVTDDAPDDVKTIWNNYFTSTDIPVSNDGATQFSAPKRRAAAEEKVLWSGKQALQNYANCNVLSNENDSWNDIDLTLYESLKFEFDANNFTGQFKFAVQNPSLGYWHSTNAQDVTSATMVYNLDEELVCENSERGKINLRSELKYGIVIQGNGPTLVKVSLVAKGGSAAAENSLVKALEEHYATQTPANNCDFDHEGTQHDFSDTSAKDYDVKVVLGNSASKSNIDYQVIWSYTSESTTTVYQGKDCSKYSSSSAPKRHAKKASRADGIPALLTDNNKWVDVNAAYSKYLPKGEEVATYPANQPMLGRTRGYDVFIQYDGQPFSGKVGMYLTTKKMIKLGDNSNQLELANLDASISAGGASYTLYSQSKYNKAQDGALSNQPAAISFKHPTSSRTFFAFEDRRLDKPNGPYSYWDDSSDTDVNDMIFLLANYDAIEGEGDKITEQEELIDEGFPWLWAVEDLGSTDDFDFNDLVVEIRSVTEIYHHSETNLETEETTHEYKTMYKKVTFTPVAAGGTMPLYINLKVNGTVYILQPGTYDLGATVEIFAEGSTDKPVTAEASTLINNFDEDKAEIHRWFGNGYPYTTMINTGSRINGATAKSCVIYVKAPTVNQTTGDVTEQGFRINIFDSHTGSVLDNYDVTKDSSVPIFFYVTVDRNGTQGAIYDDIDAFDGITNLGLGAAPQSFIIKTPYDAGWRWPKERVHILEAYPDFVEWVKDKSNVTWMSTSVNQSKLYER